MERSLEQPVADPTYLEFFGLARPPFGRLASTTHLFHTEQYSLLMEHLVNATTHTDSLVVICGADGSGKTTLIDRYVSSLDDQVFSVVIDETCHGEVQFYTEFLTQIGFEEIAGTPSELRNITKEFLVCRGIAGDHVLLIIDNAHFADPIILEQLRSISEIKIKDRRVISVVLTGNADLVHVINAPAMSGINFGSQVVFNIRSYSREETASYVWHRLRLAGGTDGVKLANEANLLIHRYSGGIPQQINSLCNDMLAEACSLETRVISEGVVRTVADKRGLLPHVVPLHGKGRRKTDPDFEHVKAVPQTAKTTADGAGQTSKSIEDSVPPTAEVGPEELLKYVSKLAVQVEDLRADKVRALHDIDARNNDIVALRKQLNAHAEKVEKLTRSLAANAEEITRQNLLLSSNATALQVSEKRSMELAADLEEEVRVREAAQNELAEAIATVEELESLRDELASRDKALDDLETRLEESQAECESAQQRVAALKSPQELEEIVKASDKRAADLEKESRARESAEEDLARTTATVDELNGLNRELRATIDEVRADLEAGLKAADERAAEIETLEKSAADLKDELEGKTGELDSLRDELASRDKALDDLEVRLEESQAECESAQQRIAVLKNPQELEEVEKAADKLAADLREEKRARKASQKKLAKSEATVDELNQRKMELQATVDDLQADLEDGLKVAEERASKIEALEKDAADLKDELEGKTGELDSLGDELASRNEILADLEIRLDRSQSACELAQQRIVALKSPQEIAELEEASDELAADLEKETRAREAAEGELAQATAKVNELSQLNTELQATVDEVQAEYKSAELRIAMLKNPEELEEVKSASDKLAADLEKEMRAREAAENELAQARAAADELETLKLELQSTVENVQADLEAGRKVADERAVEIGTLEVHTANLEQEVEGKTGELASLQDELESLQDRLASRDREIADLDARLEDSRTEYEHATAEVDELEKLKLELQATVENVQADLEVGRKVADERSAEIGALEKYTADLEEEVEGKTGELAVLQDELKSLQDRLASRDKEIADLDARLEDSQAKYESTQLRIAALKNPEELEEFEKRSNKLAADLRKERRAREAVESELARTVATVKEMAVLERELRATVHDLNADLRVAAERAVDAHVLERNVTDLKEEIEKRTRELDSRNKTLAELEKQLEASQNECESLRRRGRAVSADTDVVPKKVATAPARDTRFHSSHVVAKFEQTLSNVSAYQTLKEFDPAFYDGLIGTYKQLVGLDLTDKQVNDALRARQAKLIEKLLPGTSDDAIVAYARLIVDQLDELRLDGSEPSLTLLIPQPGPDDTSPVYSEVTKGRELDLLDITLRTYDADRQMPGERDVWPDLGPIFEELFEEFGADNVAAMENSYDPDVDRALVCRVTRALYSGVLNLPKRKAANALRWLLST